MDKFINKLKYIKMGDSFLVLSKSQFLWLVIVFYTLLSGIGWLCGTVLTPWIKKYTEGFPSLIFFGVDFLVSLILGLIILVILFKIKAVRIGRRNLELSQTEIFCDRSKCRSITAIRRKSKNIPALCQLFSAQTDDINQATETAAEEIINSITTIEAAVNGMSQNIKTAIAEAEEIKQSGDTTVKTLEQGLEGLSHYLRASLEERLEQKDNIKAVIDEASSLTKLTTYVKSIANQTNLLSVNAAVEAARAGKHGVGFSVVSEEIRKLSIHSEKTADEIEARINGLITSIDTNLSSLADEQANQQNTAKLNEFVSQVRAMSDLTTQIENLNFQILKTVEEDSESITATVINALGSIQFQDITRQRLEQIQKGLLSIAEQIEAVVQHGHDPELLETLEDIDIEAMKDGYRMQSQRTIHTEFTGESAAAESPDLPQIELF